MSAAFFLANSWFWCIGGFLPVVLGYEFGTAGFVVFLIVNVTGAALFGFVMNDSAQKRFLSKFALHGEIFSAVVMTYHVVFVVWLSTLLASPLPLLLFALATAIFIYASGRRVGMSVVLTMATALLFALALAQPIDNVPAAIKTPGFIHYILPLGFGFLLAPYFDLTFHRAARESAHPKLSFAVGFGAIFTVMMLGMYFATPLLSQLISGQVTDKGPLALIVAALVLQFAFTTAAHARELDLKRWSQRRFATPALLAVTTLSAAQMAVALLIPDLRFAYGDVIYRSFLFVIGAVFPIILIFDGLNPPALLAILLLGPCYALGFLIGAPFAPLLTLGMAMVGAVYFFTKVKRPATPVT